MGEISMSGSMRAASSAGGYSTRDTQLDLLPNFQCCVMLTHMVVAGLLLPE